MKGLLHSISTNEVCEHCGQRGPYVFSRSRNFTEPCDSCGKPVHYHGDTESKSNVSFYVNRTFTGSQRMSITHMFTKGEVNEARRAYPNHQHCIHDSGRVLFNNRAEERSFVKRAKELESTGR